MGLRGLWCSHPPLNAARQRDGNRRRAYRAAMTPKRATKVKQNYASIEGALDSQPIENLALIETEVQRQRDLMGRKVSNAYTRATLLVGAAGVLGGVSASTSIGSRFALLGLLSIGLYVLAAIFGLLAMRPMSGDEVDIDAAVLGSAHMTEVQLKRAFVLSHLRAQGDYEGSLASRTHWIVRGFIVIGVAWIVATTGTTLGVLWPGPTEPYQVTIVK